MSCWLREEAPAHIPPPPQVSPVRTIPMISKPKFVKNL